MDNLIPYTKQSSKLKSTNSPESIIKVYYSVPDPRLHGTWVEARWLFQDSYHDFNRECMILVKVEGIIWFNRADLEGCEITTQTDPPGIPYPAKILKVYELMSKQMRNWVRNYKPEDYDKYRDEATRRNLKQEYVRFI